MDIAKIAFKNFELEYFAEQINLFSHAAMQMAAMLNESN